MTSVDELTTEVARLRAELEAEKAASEERVFNAFHDARHLRLMGGSQMYETIKRLAVELDVATNGPGGVATYRAENERLTAELAHFKGAWSERCTAAENLTEEVEALRGQVAELRGYLRWIFHSTDADIDRRLAGPRLASTSTAPVTTPEREPQVGDVYRWYADEYELTSFDPHSETWSAKDLSQATRHGVFTASMLRHAPFVRHAAVTTPQDKP